MPQFRPTLQGVVVAFALLAATAPAPAIPQNRPAIAAEALPGSAWARTPPPPGRSAPLWDLLWDYDDAWAEANPEGASLRGDLRFNDRLADPSCEAAEAWTARLRGFLARLDALGAGGLGAADRLDAALLRYTLNEGIEQAGFHPEQVPISSVSGPQVWLPQLGSRVPMLTGGQQSDYVARLRAVPSVIDATIASMRAGMEAGRVPPRATVLAAPAQARAQASEAIAEDPSRSPFYAPFLSRPDSARAPAAREAIVREIVPAYARLAVFLEDEYLPACRETVGASESIDGAAWYASALRSHTTTTLGAEEIHAIGLGEVARIRAEMMDVIRRTDWFAGIASDDRPLDDADDDELFAAFTAYLRTDPRFYFTNPADLVSAYRDCAKRIDPELVGLFGVLPRLPYGVREIPRFAAKSSPTAYYYPGSVEGGVPGYFMANTERLDQRPRYDIVPLTLHEAVPGHHLQIALAQEMQDVHPFRRRMGVTAFIEGWGLYAEKLGLEMGPDADRGLFADPYDDFGRLIINLRVD